MVRGGRGVGGKRSSIGSVWGCIGGWEAACTDSTISAINYNKYISAINYTP